ncbi:efflux RND transporter periplasmic adaptor subunit [Planctomycetota bacterium]
MVKQQSNRPGFVRDVLRIVLPLAILAAGFAGYWVLSQQREPPEQEDVPEEMTQVETVGAKKHESGLDIEIDGVVVPYREIELSAEVDGQIEKKWEVCRAGSFVKGGTLLLEIDPRDYDLERERLQNEVKQAEANWKELDAEIKKTSVLADRAQRLFDLEQANFDRLEEIRNKDRGYVSEERYNLAEQNKLQMENAWLTLDHQKNVLSARLELLEAAEVHAGLMLKKADLDWDRTKILFPKGTDGVIVSDLVEQGDYVRKGTPLVMIEDTSKVEVKCNLRVEELYWLWNQTGLGPGRSGEGSADLAYEIPRAPVTVVYRLAGRDYEWSGVLARYDGVGLDQATRTVPCRVVVDAPRKGSAAVSNAKAGETTGPPALVRGMYVIVRVHGEPQAPLIWIPEKAVRPGDKVWVVRDGKLVVLDVRVVRVADGRAIVVAGDLAEGGRVVVTPLAKAVDGMEVEEKQREKAVR